MVMISLSTSPGCGPRFLAGWASWLSSYASQCGPKAWQKSSNWQKSSTSRSNIDASPPLMAPTQKEELKGDKGLASPQTRNSGYRLFPPLLRRLRLALREPYVALVTAAFVPDRERVRLTEPELWIRGEGIPKRSRI